MVVSTDPLLSGFGACSPQGLMDTGRTNVAPTDVSWVIVSVQGDLRPAQAPVQRRKIDPSLAAALTLNAVP